ncbi:hypothetical protein M3Y94_00037300 [Aphelenchoides besseyi]|nr:hypothetical protein M3Y94_00037300 [Aphelenchoides besseyi]
MAAQEPTCLCGLGVHRGTELIAKKSVGVAIVGIIAAIVQMCLLEHEKNNTSDSVWFAAFNNLHRYLRNYLVLSIGLGLAIAGGLTAILLIFGVKRGILILYWPFIFYAIAELLAALTTIAVWIISTIQVVDDHRYSLIFDF